MVRPAVHQGPGPHWPHSFTSDLEESGGWAWLRITHLLIISRHLGGRYTQMARPGLDQGLGKAPLAVPNARERGCLPPHESVFMLPGLLCRACLSSMRRGCAGCVFSLLPTHWG